MLDCSKQKSLSSGVIVATVYSLNKVCSGEESHFFMLKKNVTTHFHFIARL